MMQNEAFQSICMPDDASPNGQNFMMQFGNFQGGFSPSAASPQIETEKVFANYEENSQQQPQSLIQMQLGATQMQMPVTTDIMGAQNSMNLMQGNANQDPAAQQVLFQQQMQAQQLYQQQLYQQQLYQQQVQVQQQQMMLQNPNAMNAQPGQIGMTAYTNFNGVLGSTAFGMAEDGGIGQRVGTVNRWFLDKRSGWIRGDDGINLFVHYTDVLGTRQDLQEGERVSYYLGWNQKLQKQKAELVKPLVEKPLPPQQVTTSPLEGKVTRWDETKNFGFIAYNTGSVFVHYSDLIGREKLAVGERVSFEIVVNAACGKHKAVRVSVLEDETPALEQTLEAPTPAAQSELTTTTIPSIESLQQGLQGFSPF